jgi:hypothetical protein
MGMGSDKKAKLAGKTSTKKFDGLNKKFGGDM